MYSCLLDDDGPLYEYVVIFINSPWARDQPKLVLNKIRVSFPE